MEILRLQDPANLPRSPIYCPLPDHYLLLDAPAQKYKLLTVPYLTQRTRYLSYGLSLVPGIHLQSYETGGRVVLVPDILDALNKESIR